MAWPPLPPLPAAAASLVAGLLVAPVSAATWLLPLCLALATVWTEVRGPALALALGLLAGWALERRAEADPGWVEGQARVTSLEGEVLEAEPPAGGRIRFVLQASVAGEGARRRPFHARVEVGVEGAWDLDLRPGDRLRLLVRLEAPAGPRNPGEADRRAWTRRRGIDLVGWIEAPEGLQLTVRSASLAAELHALRSGAAAALSARLAGADAGLARALLLGDRGSLSSEDARLFREAGQSHVVAVSGQHVTLVLAAVLLLVRALGLGRAPAAAVGLVAVLLYVPLAGAAPSAVRSGLGSSLWLLARLLARRGQVLTLLAGVALAMLAVKPEDLGDPGFTLSFAAVLGIELLAPRLLASMARPTLRIPGLLEPRRPRLRAALAVALAAWLAGAPIALHVFGQLAPAAAPWALLAVPLATLLLGLSALLLLVGALPPAAQALGWLFSTTADILREVLSWPAPLGLGALDATPPGDLWLAAALAALVLAALGPRRLLRWALLAEAGLLLAALAPTAKPAPPWPSLLVLDVGRATSALLSLPDGAHVLLGAGSEAEGDPARRIVLPALRTRGVEHLDLALLPERTGPRHGALATVLERLPAERTFALPGADDGRTLLEGPWGRLERRRGPRGPTLWLSTPQGELLLWPLMPPTPGEGARETVLGPEGPHTSSARPATRASRLHGYDRAAVPLVPPPEPTTLLLFAAALAAFALLSVRPLAWLAPGGALGAFLLGLLATASLGWPAFAALLAPFLVATLLGRLPGRPHEGGRSFKQVLANGLPAVVGALAALLGAAEAGAAFLVGGLACLGADTCATEIGTRYGGPPRALLGGRALAAGESGGVTRAGLLASLGGAALAPAAYAAFTGAGARLTALLTAAGFVGALLDSALGATLQFRGRDQASGGVTERTHAAGRALQRVSGWRWLDNDAVNLVSGLCAGLLALALAHLA